MIGIGLHLCHRRFEDLLLLSAVPEIQIRTLSPEDEFIVLACDGLWDVWHNSQRVIEVARQNLQQNHNDPQACAQFLVQTVCQLRKS